MRKLAAIMFTDLVGYSALSQKNEALALELLKEHQALLRPLFSQHNGTEIKTIGDAFLVEFASAVNAAKCAIDIQKMLIEHAASATPERRIQLRIGLHVGDVVFEGGDVLGDGVNIASRIEPLAQPGGICVSEDVAHQIENKIDQPLEFLGEKELKGIQKPVTVYRIVLPWEQQAGFLKQALVALRKPVRARWVQAGVMGLLIAAGVGWWWTGQLALTIRPGQITRLAVLPFDNFTGDPEMEYFVQGMHEALISSMARLSGLTVISRTSVMQYKDGSRPPVPVIARELNVAAVVEASVSGVGDRVRITAQLIHGITDEHLWVQEYDRKIEDILTLYSEVTRSIAAEIELSLTPEEETRLAATRPVDPVAYEAHLRGRFAMQQWTPIRIESALRHFQQGLEHDPDNALLLTDIASLWGYRVTLGMERPHEAWPKTKSAALRALALDETLPEAHLAMGHYLFYYAWDWDTAVQKYQRAIELAPNFADGHIFYGHILTALGRPEEGTFHVLRALELDPFNIFNRALYAVQLQLTGHFEQMLEQAQIVIEAAPAMPMPYLLLATLSERKGRFSEALAEMKAFFARMGNQAVADALNDAKTEGDYREAMHRAADILDTQSHTSFVMPIHAVILYDHAGQLEQTFEWLERAIEERDHNMVYFNVIPWTDELRADPRFAEIVRRMNFPE